MFYTFEIAINRNKILNGFTPTYVYELRKKVILINVNKNLRLNDMRSKCYQVTCV